MQRIYRLKSNASFNYVYKKGLYTSSTILAVNYINAASIRVGVSVSKKIGKSVVRNLVKRRIKECFRQLIPSLKVKCNYVIVARPGIENASFSQIYNALVMLLTRLKHL